MPQLAANWNDKRLVCHSFPLIDLELHANGQQGGTLYEGDRERLSEGTLPISLVAKRSDSPNPERLMRAIILWNENKTYKEICGEVNIPETTLKRYLISMGYKRDYSFVSSKLLNKPKSEEHKKNLSISRKVKGIARGEKNYNWKGGISNPKIQIWNTTEYKLWRTSVFVRDNFICQGCEIRNEKGLGKTVQLEAHHILPRRDFPHLTLELSNGITLCKHCHDKTRKKEYLSVNIWQQRVQNS